MESTHATIQEFISFSDKLPDSTHRNYETAIADYAFNKFSDEDFNLLFNWLKKEDISSDIPIYFSTFILLCTFSRRMKNNTRYKETIDAFGSYFEHELLYPHFKALYHKARYTSDDMEYAIQYAMEAVENLPEQVGVLHNYVEIIITANEIDMNLSDDLLTEAKETMKIIMRKDSRYAKFHCTRGRLYALLGDFKEAEKAILKSIDLEDSTKKDYVMRINDYQSHLIRIQTVASAKRTMEQLEQTRHDLKESKEKLKVSMDKMKSENIQFLGFFVAIISLTIGSLNMISNRSFLESALLIIILTGAILIGYVGLSLMFQSDTNKNKQKWFILAIGLFLIAGSMLTHILQK